MKPGWYFGRCRSANVPQEFHAVQPVFVIKGRDGDENLAALFMKNEFPVVTAIVIETVEFFGEIVSPQVIDAPSIKTTTKMGVPGK